MGRSERRADTWYAGHRFRVSGLASASANAASLPPHGEVVHWVTNLDGGCAGVRVARNYERRSIGQGWQEPFEQYEGTRSRSPPAMLHGGAAMNLKPKTFNSTRSIT